MSRFFVAALALFLLAAPAATAATLAVPGDYGTIQDAVDAAAPGDVIRCQGTFTEEVVILEKEDLTLVGKCTIQGLDSCIRVEDCLRVTLSRLELVGAKVDALVIRDSTEVTVTKCVIGDCGDDGIQVMSSDGTRIDRCRIEATGNHGIHMPRVAQESSVQCRIEKNRILECGADGIQCPGTAGLIVSRNRIEACDEDGIAFQAGGSAAETEISKNRLQDLGGTGVVVGGTDARVVSNRVSRCLYIGIEMRGIGNLAERNRVKTVGDGGIAFVEGPGRAYRNKVSDVGFYFPEGGFQTGDGIECDTPGHLVEKNVVKKVRSSGVHIWDADGCVVTGNKVSRTGDDGFKVEGDGNMLVGNKASKVTDDGFEVTGAGNTLRENVAKRSPDLDLENNPGDGANLYQDNRFGTTNL